MQVVETYSPKDKTYSSYEIDDDRRIISYKTKGFARWQKKDGKDTLYGSDPSNQDGTRNSNARTQELIKGNFLVISTKLGPLPIQQIIESVQKITLEEKVV